MRILCRAEKKTFDNETFVMIIIRILYKVIHFMNVCNKKNLCYKN